MGRDDQKEMKWGGYVQLNCSFGAASFQQLYGAIDAACVPGDYHLTLRVDVRRTAHLSFGGLFARGHDDIQISTKNCPHRAHADRHSLLHITTTRPHRSASVPRA